MSHGNPVAVDTVAMRCPECHSLNDEAASACGSCGLLLISVPQEAAPKRRSEDLAGQRRRAKDQTEPCPFCNGTIARGVIRCRHCSEVIDADFYRQRAQRVRSRVNYASW